MIANYHTHTYRCNHASEEIERAYIETAIKAGFKELGFADHTPMPLPQEIEPEKCWSFMNFRMDMEQTGDYVSTLLSLREEYKNDIKIHIGFEVEYIPDIFDELMSFLSSFPTDYIILGQHFDKRVEQPTFFTHATRSKEVLSHYTDLVCEGMRTGKFTYLAHPDLCNYHGSIVSYEKETIRLVKTAKECGVPLEINLLGLNNKRHYPCQLFWSIAGDIGCDVIIGSDAHDSNTVKPERALYYAQKIVEQNPGLNLLETVQFKSIK